MDPFLERIALQEEVYDLLLISCAKEEDTLYWENRLDRCLSIKEEWSGGAGNALGTLHAIEQAEKKARLHNRPSPLNLLANGGSVALYHTAGKGSRMSPLTEAEGGMKAAIKLPAFLPNKKEPLSILEMVIRQTAPLSSLSKGRLSVFWTDQLFLPSDMSWAPPTSDVEVYAMTLSDVEKKNLSSYGIWQGNHYLDKLTEVQLNSIPQDEIAVNLGSFSLSYAFLKTLLQEYEKELLERRGKLDTDPDWWMVTSLSKENYLQLKGKEKEASFDRFKPLSPSLSLRLLGPETDWWDFGTVSSYREQLKKLLLFTPEAFRLRTLFGIPEPSNNSLAFSSRLENCSLNGSILLNVKAKNCHFDQVIAFNTELEASVLSHSLLYGKKV